MGEKIRVLVWNEGRHEKTNETVKSIYPDGMHTVIAGALSECPKFEVSTATLDTDEEHGLSEEVLANTDVLLWWGHMAHHLVKDEVAARVHQRVLDGMGFIGLHSAHLSKPFVKLMGTGCMLKWREIGEKERLWIIDPAHPIAADLPEYFELPHTELYGEHFDIATPDQLVFVSWFAGGEIFRSGCCWHRCRGKVFYFRPGHETYPIYYDKNVQQVLKNAVKWARPTNSARSQRDHWMPPLEDIDYEGKA